MADILSRVLIILWMLFHPVIVLLYGLSEALFMIVVAQVMK